MKNIIIFLSLCVIAACSSMERQPSWIDNPGHGVVGSATTHIRGRYYQEELAIARARGRLAARLGVDVNSVQTVKEKVVNQTAFVTSDKEIQQTVKNKTVKAYVKDLWHDRDRDELWVWMIPTE